MGEDKHTEWKESWRDQLNKQRGTACPSTQASFLKKYVRLQGACNVFLY